MHQANCSPHLEINFVNSSWVNTTPVKFKTQIWHQSYIQWLHLALKPHATGHSELVWNLETNVPIYVFLTWKKLHSIFPLVDSSKQIASLSLKAGESFKFDPHPHLIYLRYLRVVKALQDNASPDKHLVVRINHRQDDRSLATLCDTFIIPSISIPSISLLKAQHSFPDKPGQEAEFIGSGMLCLPLNAMSSTPSLCSQHIAPWKSLLVLLHP